MAMMVMRMAIISGENEDGEDNGEDDGNDVDEKKNCAKLLYIVSWNGRAPFFSCPGREIVGDFLFATAHIFANGPHLIALTQLRATKTG